jgi:bacteriocin biosynthesis cyclodehydratase domain-containing protein
VRPILRPGTHVLRRGAGEVQVGLDPRTALVLPDSPAVRASLRLLGTGSDLAAYDEAAVLDVLAGHDQLLDERDLTPLLGEDPGAATTTAALARASGSEASRLRGGRRRWRTELRTFGHPAAADLHDRFAALAGTAGLAQSSGRSSARAPDCAVLLGVGEPERELLDGWTRAGTPHLLVRVTEGRAVVGPFVVPGTTACLRCVDAHCTDADPAWPLLVRQYAAASARDRSDGVPEPVDPLLAALALAWAARDLTAYVDGRRPSCWSATVTLHPEPGHVETRSWLRHPACACTWE